MAATEEKISIFEANEWYTSVGFIATVAVFSLTLILLLVYRKFIVILCRTFPRDAVAAVRFIRVSKTLRIMSMKNMTVAKSFDLMVEKFPNKVCFYFENQEWTYKQVADYSNRVANFFQSQGFRKGDNVALFLSNRPEFPCMWLGLSRLGTTCSLINSNLRNKGLLHSIKVVDSKAIIYGHELTEALQDLKDEGLLPNNLPLYCSGHGTKPITLENSIDLDEAIKRNLGTTPEVKEVVGFHDNLVWIYTSGTTGLPKGACVKMSRYFMMVVGGHFMHDLNENDIQYTALPLYHSAGGILGIGQALTYGTSVVIKKKFSASNFWIDCIRYKVTVAQYIGEICRYLYSQPPSAEDQQHRCTKMYGNGMRLEIWGNFVQRFNIKHIGELYGSTEGNCSLINMDNKIGAVGFFPRLAYPLLPTSLVKVNEETGEILRNPKNNRVIVCKPGESGEIIGKIVTGNPLREFQGYADPEEREKKILRDAFRKGDAWFRSNDILMMDELGYFYFKDRKGDTFRWKGENCSTSEVESVVSKVCGHRDAVVYGVEIPGNEGRCGMAAIADPNETLDMEELALEVTKNLPAYSRPLFIRVMRQVELTSTYKLRKVDLCKEGYDIDKIKDKIYFFSNFKYVPLDFELYNKLKSGQMRL